MSGNPARSTSQPDTRPAAKCAHCGKNALVRLRTEPHLDSAYRISEHLYECTPTKGGCGKLWLYQKTLVCETRNRYIPRDDPDAPAKAKTEPPFTTRGGRI